VGGLHEAGVSEEAILAVQDDIALHEFDEREAALLRLAEVITIDPFDPEAVPPILRCE